MTPAKLTSLLNELIETSTDGEQGFLKAAEDTRSAPLKIFFRDCATRCAEGARELQEMVAGMGGKPETEGSVAGAMHRGWMNVREAMSARDDLAVLEECERGEDHAKRSYADALAKDLPEWVREVLQRQYDGVRFNHDQVRALRDDRK